MRIIYFFYLEQHTQYMQLKAEVYLSQNFQWVKS